MFTTNAPIVLSVRRTLREEPKQDVPSRSPFAIHATPTSRRDDKGRRIYLYSVVDPGRQDLTAVGTVPINSGTVLGTFRTRKEAKAAADAASAMRDSGMPAEGLRFAGVRD